MKDFALDAHGDILIEAGKMVLVHGKEQEIQKIRQVLGTKLGEWAFDEKEGIDFDALSQKQPDLQRIRETLQNGLQEINASYVLQSCSYNVQERTLYVQATAAAQEVLECYVPIATKQ